MVCKEFLGHVSNKTLTAHIQTIRSIFPNKRLTLGLFGMERYFRFQKNQKNNEFRQEVAGAQRNTKDTSTFKDTPKISRREIEFALTELQILCKVCYRMLETSHDVALLVTQFVKSVAQLPYK